MAHTIKIYYKLDKEEQETIDKLSEEIGHPVHAVIRNIKHGTHIWYETDLIYYDNDDNGKLIWEGRFIYGFDTLTEANNAIKNCLKLIKDNFEKDGTWKNLGKV